MKRLFMLSFGLLLFALPSHAQSNVDASVGYSYFHLGGLSDLNQNGISGSVAYKPIPYLGIVGDFGGYHGSLFNPAGGGGVGGQSVSVNTYTFLFGPRIIMHNPTKFTPFVQFLAGAGHLTVSPSGLPTTNFAYSVGGGVDIGVLPHLAVRPQLDYVGIRSSDNTPNANSTRVSVSAVIRF
jgi:opacity protein-like surface antigen